MYSSPEAIRRLADAMRKQADQIDGQAARLVGDSDRLVWEGLAATAMRAHVRWQANELRQAAIRHREAATDLDHHAARIAYLLDMIAQIEHTVVQAVAAAKARVLRVLDGLLDSVTPLMICSPDSCFCRRATDAGWRCGFLACRSR